MKRKNLFVIAALAAMGILFASCPTGGGGGGGGDGELPTPRTTTTVFRNADTELTITQTAAKSVRALANGSGTYILKNLDTLETISAGAVTISGGGVRVQFTPATSGQQSFSVDITAGQIPEITIKVSGGVSITISGLAEISGDALKAADLARDINAMEGQSEGSVGKAEANGATVTITGGFVDFRSNITVPAGVTLEVTENGAFIGLHDVTLTVNGTVNAKSGCIQLEDTAKWGTINGSGTVNLQGGGSLFHVEGNKNEATLTLTIDGVTLVGVKDNSDSLVGVGVGGVFILKSGTITGNSTTGSGGGVSVHESSYQNEVNNPIVGSGTFIMEGGTISGNTAGEGGGVSVRDHGTFTMKSGTISGNTASDEDGGGVDVDDHGTFTMEGGTISGNTANNGDSDGGGVHVRDSGTFTMNGGTISGNTVSNSGGGVFVSDSGTFTMNSGAISGNIASNDGGGVFIQDTGAFTMEGGTIGGNTAGNGGGVSVKDSNSTFTLKGGTVYGSAGAGPNANISTSNAALFVDGSATAKWGTGGSYTEGGASKNDGGTITSTDNTLIAIP
jgi:parallel beta-helix repeat protein